MKIATVLAGIGPTLALGTIAAAVWGVTAAGSDTTTPTTGRPAIEAPAQGAPAIDTPSVTGSKAVRVVDTPRLATPAPEPTVEATATSAAPTVQAVPTPQPVARSAARFDPPAVETVPDYRVGRATAPTNRAGDTDGLAACTVAAYDEFPVDPADDDDRHTFRDAELRRCLTYYNG